MSNPNFYGGRYKRLASPLDDEVRQLTPKEISEVRGVYQPPLPNKDRKLRAQVNAYHMKKFIGGI